jgi:hypothetical protein
MRRDEGLEEFFDVGFQRARRRRWREAFDNVAFAIDQKLSEVPFEAPRPEHSEAGGFQETVKRIGAGAVDIDLGEERECDVVLQAAEVFDFVGVSGLLVAELVAREAEDREALRVILAVECFETGILRRKSTFARDIDDQQHLPSAFGKRLLFAIYSCHMEVVESMHWA